MKIQCDVCGKAEAAVYCTADEAALCSACDHRVHHANKLASKHRRFSLLTPSAKHFPLCDICQEKRAFLFCQQDRAILCRDCDHPIHAANEHMQKHTRYLLTGVKLSNTSELYQGGSVTNPVPDPKTKPVPISNSANLSGNINGSATIDNGGLLSSISEYLIETLPGWHVEDFLDNCKADDGTLIHEENFNSYSASSFSSENLGVWVPQAPQAPLYQSEMGKGTTNSKALNNSIAASTRWSDDGSFTVPQMNFPTPGSKRSRTFW